MGITKRAKSITAIDHERMVKHTQTSYTCPSCFVEFWGCGPGKRTMRFVCACGQELIVKDRRVEEE